MDNNLNIIKNTEENMISAINHIEDELFLKNNLPIRKNCFEKYTDDQYVSILKEICKIYSNSITKKK